ncbi:MAG: hypothetical protein LR015_08595 [Verrucomicrobia bacterium]|nr:hypothetical protein [Verrucomicrobiota bacterium]
MANGSDWLADPDGDGVVNLIEYAFGTHPLDATSSPSIAIVEQGDNVQIVHPPIVGSTFVTIEVSEDMNIWNEADHSDPADFAPTPGRPLFWRFRIELNDDSD